MCVCTRARGARLPNAENENCQVNWSENQWKQQRVQSCGNEYENVKVSQV
jgi:hypothetical protein